MVPRGLAIVTTRVLMTSVHPQFKDSDLAKIIKDNLGVDVGSREFFSFPDLDQSIKDDVALLAKEPLLIKGTPIIGLRYDCTTGALH